MSMVALVPGRVRWDLEVAGEVRDQAESILLESGFFAGASFARVGLILRYGKRNAERPEYQPINREYGELPISMELDMNTLHGAKRSEVRRMFLEATLKALVDVGRKYGLPTAALEEALAGT